MSQREFIALRTKSCEVMRSALSQTWRYRGLRGRLRKKQLERRLAKCEWEARFGVPYAVSAENRLI